MRGSSSTLIRSVFLVPLSVGLTLGLLQGCGKFGYGELGKSIQNTIETARTGGGTGPSTGGEHGEINALDTPELDAILNVCVSEPLPYPYDVDLHAPISEALIARVPSESRALVLAQSHRRAMSMARQTVERCLRDNGQVAPRRQFITRWVRSFGGFHSAAYSEREEDDLTKALDAIYAQEGMPRASAFLRIYFRHYIRAFEPFSRLSDEVREGGALLAPVEQEWAQPSVTREGGAIRIVLRNWDSSEQVESVLRDLEIALEPSEGAEPVTALALDLRAAAGTSLELHVRVVAAMRAAADQGRSILIWIDSATRGTPELAAAALRTHDGVALVGERSAGFSNTHCESGLEGTQLKLIHVCGELRPEDFPEGAELPVAVDVSVAQSTLTREAVHALTTRGIILAISAPQTADSQSESILQLKELLAGIAVLEEGFGQAAEAWSRIVSGEAPANPAEQ